MTMFLSMLAGDVASAHGHEFSAPRTPTPAARTTQGQPRRLTLPRAVLPSTRQRSPHGPHGPSPLGPSGARRAATTPVRSASVKLTMAELREEPEEEVEEEESRHSQDSLLAYTMPGAFHGSMRKGKEIRASPTVSTPITPMEPHIQTTMSPSESLLVQPSIESSPAAPTTEEPTVDVSPKRAQRPKTMLRFAHPPPPTRPLGKKGILRPKVLLQLQQRQESGFHKPLYEILPANRFAPSTKLGQKLQRLHRGKDGLEATDLVVVNAEDYLVSDTSSEEIEISDSKAVVGIISPSSSATMASTFAEFSLDNIVWRITAGPNGASYIIESQGYSSQMARWYVPKRKRTSAASPITEGRKFYFTTILPDTKQHPIIASMTETNLEISDSYTVASREEEIVTDELTRKLIVVTAAWVFFMEGWSNSYKVKQTSSTTYPTPLHSRASSVPTEPTRRRSIFATSPCRSPSFPAPSPSLSSSKSPSPEPLNPPDTLNLSEPPTSVSDRTVLESSQGAIVSDRKVSQTSQITVSETLTQSQQPEPDHNATIMPQTNTPITPAATQSRTPGPIVVPRIRATGDPADKALKRRSWSHHDVPHWVRQGGLGSLSRSMSSRLKRDRPSIRPPTDVAVAPSECQPAIRQERGLRHLRRLSQQLLHLNAAKTDAADITATVLRPYTPKSQPSSAPASRPTTAKSLPGTVIIASENTNSINAPPKEVSKPVVSETKALITPSALPSASDGPVSAAQSTETLPDMTQVSWWQQYDQFMQQHQHQHFRRLERQISPVIEDAQLVEETQLVEDAQLVEPPDQRMPSFTSTMSPTSPSSSVAGNRRLSNWKNKLKTKLHV